MFGIGWSDMVILAVVFCSLCGAGAIVLSAAVQTLRSPEPPRDPG